MLSTIDVKIIIVIAGVYETYSVNSFNLRLMWCTGVERLTLIIALIAIVLSDISLNEEKKKKKNKKSIKKLKRILSTVNRVSASFLLAAGKKATDDNINSYGWYTKYYRLTIK